MAYAAPRITYNSKTIDLSSDRPIRRNVDVRVPRSVQTTVTGASETLTVPRVDVHVQIEFRQIDSESLLRALDNWWQWAQQGNSWTLTLDNTRMVSTTLTTMELAGDTSISVASATGITTGQYYVMVGGPNYQMIEVTGVAGTGITIGSSLDYDFASGSKFRDPYYWDGIIRNPNQNSPIEFVGAGQDGGQSWPPKRFNLHLDFYEATTS